MLVGNVFADKVGGLEILVAAEKDSKRGREREGEKERGERERERERFMGGPIIRGKKIDRIIKGEEGRKKKSHKKK